MFQHSALPKSAVEIPRSLPRIGAIKGLIHLDRLVPLPTSLRDYLTWSLVMGVMGGLAFLQVWTTLRIAEADAELVSLEIEYDLVQQQNAELLWRISHYTTLEYVEKRATELGYRTALQRQYLMPSERGDPGPKVTETQAPFPAYEASSKDSMSVDSARSTLDGSFDAAFVDVTAQREAADFVTALRRWWRPHVESASALLAGWRESLSRLPDVLDHRFPPNRRD